VRLRDAHSRVGWRACDRRTISQLAHIAGSRAGDFADFLATRARYALSRCLPLHTASDFCGNGDLIGGFTTRV